MLFQIVASANAYSSYVPHIYLSIPFSVFKLIFVYLHFKINHNHHILDKNEEKMKC